MLLQPDLPVFSSLLIFFVPVQKTLVPGDIVADIPVFIQVLFRISLQHSLELGPNAVLSDQGMLHPEFPGIVERLKFLKTQKIPDPELGQFGYLVRSGFLINLMINLNHLAEGIHPVIVQDRRLLYVRILQILPVDQRILLVLRQPGPLFFPHFPDSHPELLLPLHFQAFPLHFRDRA